MARTYEEHIESCKRRALVDLPADPEAAVCSMLSDLNKHEETKPILMGPLGMIGMQLRKSGDVEMIREWIEGF